jgi:hypothetical protein
MGLVAALSSERPVAKGNSLSQLCAQFAGSGAPLPNLIELIEKLERLMRENLELRRKLAIEEAAQDSTARHLDGAFRRIHELTEELAATQHQAGLVERELAELRAAYTRSLAGAGCADLALRSLLGEARPDRETPPLSTGLAEARLAANQAAPHLRGTGSGRLPRNPADPPAQTTS